jgi:L-ascorbate metabolism protein UlaG (beta-lactamase superfamily)
MKQINCLILAASVIISQSCSSKLLVSPVRETYPQKLLRGHTTKPNADTIKFVRIGHATTLIAVGSKIILTDPWFSEKSGYYHGEPLAFSQDKLPKLSMVLVTHNHYDHFDIETFKTYADKNVPFVVPIGMGDAVKVAGFKRVYEIDPWQNVEIDGVKITACPGKHKVKEITYMIESGDRFIYFGGDSQFIPELSEIKSRFQDIDLAILSVNGLMIRPLFNKRVVMSAMQAAELCAILKPKIAVPIHYNYTGGSFHDKFILKYDGNAQQFVNSATIKAPDTRTFILETGDILTIH